MGQQCSIFSPRLDYAGVINALREQGGDLRIAGGEMFWRAILVRNPGSQLHIAAARHGQSGFDLKRNLGGALGYFSSIDTPAASAKQRVIDLLRNTRMLIRVSAEPEMDDDALEQLSAMTRQLDGMIFNGQGMLDADGCLVLDAKGRSQIEPGSDADGASAVALEEPVSSAAAAPREEAEAEPTLPPPDPRRVARRALCLVAVSYRGLLELQADLAVAERFRRKACRWVEVLGLWKELEPWERHLLYSRAGHIERQQAVNASWRIEALGVLAWALGLWPRLDYDQTVPAQALLTRMRLLSLDAAELIAGARVAPAGEIDAFALEQLAVHWRLREWSGRTEPIDFEAFCRETDFGRQLRIERLAFGSADLLVAGSPLRELSPLRLEQMLAMTQQRHQAVHWLQGWDPILSNVDTPT